MKVESTKKNNGTATKVRYAVGYGGRNYEYALHSNKRHFVRNIADIVNILEYCVFQDIKGGKSQDDESLYDFSIKRLMNDVEDAAFDVERFKGVLNILVGQMVADILQRGIK